MVAWATELAGPPGPTVTTETAIPLPAHPFSIARASVPPAEFTGVPIHMDTCFERESEHWAAVPILADDYALDGDFATGIDGSAIILAIYQQHRGRIWDYAERCNTAEYYKNAKAVKRLRTVSMAGPDSEWRGGGPFGGGPGGWDKGGGIGPSSFGYAPPGGGIFTFSGGGGSGGGGGPNDEGPGKQVVDTKPSDDGNPSDDTTPGEENPTNPGGGETGDPTVLPEPGTLALFLGLAAGFGVMRRRVSRGLRA